MNFSSVLNRIATRFDVNRIPFAITGGLALQAYGYGRFTADIDLLVPRIPAAGFATSPISSNCCGVQKSISRKFGSTFDDTIC